MALANKTIGVIAGTSNERAPAEALKAKVMRATVVAVKSREDGLVQLDAGLIDAFASDRVLLVGLGQQGQGPEVAGAAGRPPVLRALRRCAAARRLGDAPGGGGVNSALSQIYKSSALPQLYGRWFGALSRPSPVLQVMFALGRLPE